MCGRRDVKRKRLIVKLRKTSRETKLSNRRKKPRRFSNPVRYWDRFKHSAMLNWRRDAMKGRKNCLQNYPRSDFYVVAFNGVLWSCISWFSNHTCSQLAEKGVRLLSSSCSPSEDHWICNDLFLSTFYLSVKQNEWQDTNIWWKSQKP